MKIRNGIIAICASAFALTQAGIVQANNNPIPGVDIIVRKNPGGTAITVGNCQSGGGKVVKIRGQWSCTGFPRAASGESKKLKTSTGGGAGKASISDQASGGVLTKPKRN